ncbi:MAG TPA: hypothetical protein VF525_15775 [Pyrinomonadaceae bacterium]|jgi:hypothetical protein
MERKMRRLALTTLAATALLLGLTPPTGAQQARVVAVKATAAERQAGDNFHSSFASAEFAFNGQRVVQGAPFSALSVKETTQVLGDGTKVIRRMTARVYRDSAGRTRNDWQRETQFGALGLSMILDAPAGTFYMLDPQRRTALELPRTTGAAAHVGIITPQSPPEEITRLAGDRVEALGPQLIDGLEAEGVRVTTQITHAGHVGEVVYERWYSQALRRDVLIKCSDPRFGEAVYRLTGIERSEPAAQLFIVPADYTITPRKAASPGPVKSHYEN